jgi:exonuclease III
MPKDGNISPVTISIYSWNVNGIAPFLQPTITSFFGSTHGDQGGNGLPKASLRDFLRRHNWPTMLFLQEVKINSDDVSGIRALENAVRSRDGDGEPDYVAHLCLPYDNFNAREFGRKMYGVCSIIRKDFHDTHVQRTRDVSWDVEGRFLVTETRSTMGVPKLAIFNIYAVCFPAPQGLESAIFGYIRSESHIHNEPVQSIVQNCRTRALNPVRFSRFATCLCIELALSSGCL